MLKRMKKQGFTLVELLVTIVLLGIVAAIVIYNMTNVSKESKETDYERYIAAVKSAADVYATNNPDAFNDLYVSKSYLYITTGDLIKAGLLDENLKNPYTNEVISMEDKIKANLDTTTGDIAFEYPLDKNEEETFLVTISDYVVWGEPYNCMQGAGSYQLSLSDEAGELIMLDSQETIDKYHFECSLPKGFDPKVAGNYEVSYTWVTESGTRKSATRTLRVLPQVVPTFKTNVDYTFADSQSPWFTPEYHPEWNGKNPDAYKNCPAGWACLTYTPFIEGSDPESTTFKITKQGVNPKTGVQNVSNGFISKYENYRVDDGDKNYIIETIVRGHYDKNYSYSATGDERMKSKLIIPPSFITPDSNKWTTKKNYQIKEPYSPVGVVKYEYRLLKDGEKPSEKSENENVFNKTGNVTPHAVDLLKGACSNRELSYYKIAYRAINKEGFVGDWTLVDSKLTNNVSTLIKSDSEGCTDPTKCCKQDGASCYYKNKVKYISFCENTNGSKTNCNRFVVLERYDTGYKVDGKESDYAGDILAALDGVTSKQYTLNILKPGKFEINVCDGTFTAKFKYSSPSKINLIAALNDYAETKLPDNYSLYLRQIQWAVDKIGIENGYRDSNCITWRGMRKCGKLDTNHEFDESPYISHVGNPNQTMRDRYGNALYETSLYWGTRTAGKDKFEPVSIPGTHTGEGTYIRNSYYQGYLRNQVENIYVGSYASIKPIVQFRNVLYVCSGDGSASNPYSISNP